MMPATVGWLCLIGCATQQEEPLSFEHRWGVLMTTSDQKNLEDFWSSPTFLLREGETFHPAVPAEDSWIYSWIDFTASLLVPESGKYRFVLEADGGDATFGVGVHEIEASGASDWIHLEPGEPPFPGLPIALRFRLGGSDPARLRLLWEHEATATGGFPLEPVPFTSIEPCFASGADQIQEDLSGRVLFELKGCTNCHAPSETEATTVGRRQGPDLSRVGSRLSADWIRRWLSDPEKVRAGADMPKLFSGGEEREIEALVHFLASLNTGEPALEIVSNEEAIREGRTLYHSLGCIACHGALASTNEVLEEEYLSNEIPEVDVPSPFGDLANKWAAGELAVFLREPLSVHRDGRMPSFDLDEEESGWLAAYLISKWGARERALEFDPILAERGKALFTERSCSACHELAGLPPAKMARPLDDLRLETGAIRSHGVPHYDYGPEDTGALPDALRMVRRATGAPSPIDEARRTLERLNCLACHTKDGVGGPPEELRLYFAPADERVDLGDEGRLPPDLTGVGWKLTTSWLREVLVGQGRARPYLAVRMPNYGEEHVGELVEALALMEGVEPNTDIEEPLAIDELVRTGRELMGRNALGCMACHVYGNRPPTGSPGPAITQFGERLRYEWYRAFVLNPQRFRPGSRMPDFGTGMKSTLATVFDGDMRRQADAMWAYFSLGESMPPPEGVESSESYRLDIGDRPIVMRAFLPSAGARGIAVGLPLGVHYSFDAEAVRLVDVWQGEFLDLAGSWAGRGGNELEGRGPVAWEAPAGTAFRVQRAGDPEVDHERDASVGKDAGFRFRGYRLDARGEPSFLYEARGFLVEESLVVTAAFPEVRLLRRFRIKLSGEAVRFWFHGPRSSSSCRYRFDGGAWADASDRSSDADRSWFGVASGNGEQVLECELEIEL